MQRPGQFRGRNDIACRREVWKVESDFICGAMPPKCRDHARKRVRKTLGNVALAWLAQLEGETFDWRSKICGDARLVPARIDPVPAMSAEEHSHQTVQAKPGAFLVEREPLIAQGGRNSARAQQGCQQMTLRVTKAGPMRQHFGGSAGHNGNPEIRAVTDLVPHPQETLLGYGLIIVRAAGQFGGQR